MTTRNKVDHSTDIGDALGYGIDTLTDDAKPRNRSTKAELLDRQNRGIGRLGEFDILQIRAGYDVRGDSITSAICRDIASGYHIDFVDLHTATVDELAQWVGDKGYDRRKDLRRNLTDIEQNLAAIRDHPEAMFAKFARDKAPKLNTGLGIRPKLTYVDDIDKVADSMRINGSHMTPLQGELWRKEYRYARAESDIYSPYLTSLGQEAAAVAADSTKAYGGQPLGLPHIEAAGLRHSDIMDRLLAADIPDKDRRLTVDTLANMRQSKRRVEVKDYNGDVLIDPNTGEPIKRFSQYVEWINVRTSAKERGDKRGQKAIRTAVERTLKAIANLSVSTDRLACNDATYPKVTRHKGMPYWYMNAVIEPTLPVKDKSVQEDKPLMGYGKVVDCGHKDEEHPAECPIRIARRLRIESLFQLHNDPDKNAMRLRYARTLTYIGQS